MSTVEFLCKICAVRGEISCGKISICKMLSSRSPWRKYVELRPISPSVSPDVPDGGVNNVTAGCSALVLQICCAFASKCTRVHTTSARLQSMLGTTTGFLANSVSHRTRNKFVGCVSCTPLAISSCVLCMRKRLCASASAQAPLRKRERCCKKMSKIVGVANLPLGARAA